MLSQRNINLNCYKVVKDYINKTCDIKQKEYSIFRSSHVNAGSPHY